jgi:signal peptidase I
MPKNTQTTRTEPDFFDRVQIITEKFLTRRAQVRKAKREKQKAKKPIMDWLEAFIWAACMVLLANQYLIQAYRIPSGSMIDTLNIGDHVFVNKMVYGPELLPGFLKLPSPVVPKRNDIIIFESPDYISRGTLFGIVQRIIFMLTLSFIDIDRDESGQQRVHFLIKRAIGQTGDRFIIDRGELKICFSGENRWIDEREYNAARGWNHNINRLVREENYPALIAAGKARGWADMGLPVSQALISRASAADAAYSDSFAFNSTRLETIRKAVPHDKRYSMFYARHRLGWYVPEGRIFALGDNRDSSNDGRFFGPVKLDKVLGRGIVIFWPFWRVGRIN